MDLSLIVPCHNLENYISALIESLLIQDLKGTKVEIIFVLDDCTDCTYEQIAEYLPELKRLYEVKIISVKVRSCGLARNVGLDIAQGTYIMFADGDDWYINKYTFYNVANLTKVMQSQMIRFQYKTNSEIYPEGLPMMVWQWVLKKDFIDDTRFTSRQPDEDVEFINKLLFKSGGIQFIYFFDQPLYYYNFDRAGSNMNQLREKGKIEYEE